HQAPVLQGPAFAVTGKDGQRWLEARQLPGEQAYTRDLNVVARHALVVGDAHLAPFREARPAVHRPPGPARAREILRGAGVVRDEGAAGGRDHDLDAASRILALEVHPVPRGD